MSSLMQKSSRRLAAVAALSLVPVLAGSGLAMAAYGPPGPPGPPGTGGYECILTSQIVPDFAGRTIGPIRDGELLVTLHIRPYTFPGPVQVTLTEPYSAGGGCDGGPSISTSGLGGFRPIGGVGVLIGLTNEPFGRFPKPVSLTIKDTDLNRFEIGEVAPLDGNHVGSGGLRTHGPVTLSVRSSSDWVFLIKHLTRIHSRTASRNSRVSRQVPATVAITAALLPRGSVLPGNGVVQYAGNGHALTTRGSTALSR
jgi:hypothetical protein